MILLVVISLFAYLLVGAVVLALMGRYDPDIQHYFDASDNGSIGFFVAIWPIMLLLFGVSEIARKVNRRVRSNQRRPYGEDETPRRYLHNDE